MRIGANRAGTREVVGLGEGRDFFISYTAVNKPWAEWIAVTLERAGYTTLLQAWDFGPGSDFVHRMQQAIVSSARTIAVLSPAYFGSEFAEAEWRAAFEEDPSGEWGRLVPVRVQPCKPQGLLASRVYIDLVDLDEASARERLLAGVKPGERPGRVVFPGRSRAAVPEGGGGGGGWPRFPGLGPEVSNLPPRNRHFSGRGGLLLRLHADLQADAAAAVLPVGAVHGLGGVGKTQLALEYAHRFGSDYDVIWWVPAEQPALVGTALAALARRLGIPVAANQAETVTALFDQLRGQGRWLLIYDNAEHPGQLAGLLPPGRGWACAGHLPLVGLGQPCLCAAARCAQQKGFGRVSPAPYRCQERGSAGCAGPAGGGSAVGVGGGCGLSRGDPRRPRRLSGVGARPGP